MRVICLTSDIGNWLLPGFLHQWDTYSPYPITIYGFTDPGHPLTHGRFISLGDFADYPKERWSDGLIKALNLAGSEMVILMLEDYWLIRNINQRAVALANQTAVHDPSIVRFDLTSDRMYAGVGKPETRVEIGSAYDVDVWQCLEVDYNFSYQASLWNVDKLLELVRPGENPWESELNGGQRLALHPSLKVLSTYQWPVRYLIANYKGQFDREGVHQYPPRTLSAKDWAELDALAFTQPLIGKAK